jgi:large repetitive protein
VNDAASLITNVACNGGNNGSINANTSGGVSPYTYTWSAPGGTTGSISGLTAGTDTLTVKDSAGYSISTIYTITQPTALASTHDSTADNGSSNGTAGVIVSGGTNPYTYLWASGGQTTATATGLSAGTYTCTVQDNNGCTYNTSVTVKSTTGISSISSASGQITVYPNPSNGLFNIVIAVEVT